MAEISLCDLGFSKEELQEKLLDKLAKQVLTGVSYDEDGGEYEIDSGFAQRLNKLIKDQTDSAVTRIGEKFVAPKVAHSPNTS